MAFWYAPFYRLFEYIRTSSPRHMPLMTRQSYRYELMTSSAMPVALAMLEAGFLGVVALKAFGVSLLMFAIISSSPMFANITSFMWAKYARGHRKVRFINVLQIGILLCVVIFAILLPESATCEPFRRWAFTLTVVLSRCLIAGILTIRSTIWRQNYPRNIRADVTSRLSQISFLIIPSVTLLAGWLMDFSVENLRWTYLVCVGIASCGVVAFSRVRLRGERELLKFERLPNVRPQRHGEVSSIYEYDPKVPKATVWSVLRHDRMFRWYMLCQFISGTSFMLSLPVLTVVVKELSEKQCPEHMYTVSTIIISVLNFVFMCISLPLWARYLNRSHIVPFRIRQSIIAIATFVVMWIGGMCGSLLILAAAQVIRGITMGGGMLAWQLGHNDFASRRMASVYMGVHVMLTGVRGMFAPFLGLVLYHGLDSEYIVFGISVPTPAFEGIGSHVFGISFVLIVMSGIGYLWLSKMMPHQQGTPEEVI